MKKQQKKKPVKYIILILLLAVIAVAGVWTAFHIKEGRKETTTVISKTTLEKVLDISELSTGKAVYHGIAHVYDPKNDERVLYHVAYDATVKAGVDIDKIDMKVDGNTLTISLPKAEILSCKVDKDSLTEDSYVVEKHGLGAGKITADIQTKTIRTAQENLKKAAKEDNELLSQAEERAKNLITDYVNRMGEATGETYEIKWK